MSDSDNQQKIQNLKGLSKVKRLKSVSLTVTQPINYTSNILSSLFPVIFLSKHISLYALLRQAF